MVPVPGASVIFVYLCDKCIWNTFNVFINIFTVNVNVSLNTEAPIVKREFTVFF